MCFQFAAARLPAPSDRDYFCVLCQREYYGHRCCPECGQHIYSK
ncbi:putative zinc ribbon protein [Pantoea sp. JZ2]|nr:putative zinc ribbon protein [Pantoea sp. JZ2]